MRTGVVLTKDETERARAADAPGCAAVPSGAPSRLARLLAFALLVVAALVLQLLAGAYRGEMTAGADDPAHYLSGLMVHDWLAGGASVDPMPYAREYYAHYPKLAIGNWPPLFHLAQGLWMLPFPESGTSVLVLMALLTATIAWLVHEALRRPLGPAFAALGAIAFLVMRPAPNLASSVMAEIPVTLACVVAALAWNRVVEDGGPRRMALFAGALVIAVLTKQNGLLLLLLPPLHLLIGGSWRLLRSRALWAAALAVAAIVGPLLWWALPTMRAGWANPSGMFGDVGDAFTYYFVNLPRWAGVVPVLLAVLGAWHGVRAGRGPASAPRALHDTHERAPSVLWITSAAMVLATLVFHVLAPAGVDMRHMLPAYPFVAILLAAGAHWLAGELRRRGVRGPRATAVAVGIAGIALAFEAHPINDWHVRGYAQAAGVVVPRDPGARSVVLVSSDAVGEGAMVAEVAMRDPARPGHVVWRATKLLSTVTWAGREYQERPRSEAELLRLLELAGVEWVVVDRTTSLFPHQERLERAIEARPDRFALRATLDVRRNLTSYPAGLRVYRFDRSVAAPSDSVLRQVPGYEGIELAGTR